MKVTPNFFIVGGPKCGTTAMVEYLRTHPDVFISEPKEPNYLADNMPKMKYVQKEEDYLNLFKHVNGEKIIADASIFYMYSKKAIENIYKLDSNAKLLVMLRNPVEMAYSFHQQLLFTLDEDESNFNEALRKETLRKKGLEIPKKCREPKLLYYSEIAKYSEQLENIYKFFPRKNVHVLLFDDFKVSNKNSYVDVLSFLELKDDGRKEFPRINDTKRAKSKFINNIVNRPPAFAVSIAKVLRKLLNKPRLGILHSLDHRNRETIVKPEISNISRNNLIEAYKKDILKTEKIINRDLSAWLSIED